MDIQDEIERIHASKIAGKPLMHCLREVVYVVARIHGAAKLSGDEVCRQAEQAAWRAAIEYGWVTTAFEGATARSFLRTNTTQWVATVLSGEPDSPPSPNPAPQPIPEAEQQPVPDPVPGVSPLDMLRMLIERYGVDETVRRIDGLLHPDHGVSRSTLGAWKATEEGKPVSRPLKSLNQARIAEAIRRAFNAG
jgi:hypothetical protein